MARTLILVLGVALILAGLFVLLRPNTPTEGPQTREFDVRFSGRSMEPSEITVTEGDRVVLRITADYARELHLHGYDIEREVAPGEPARLSFDADLTGRFTIEDHETEEELGTLVVRPRWAGLARRRTAVLVLAALLLAVRDRALAHGFGIRYDIPVPFRLYAYGAAAAVVLTFVLLVDTKPARLPAFRPAAGRIPIFEMSCNPRTARPA